MNWVSTTENEKWSENNTYSSEKGEELIIIDDSLGKPLYGWGCCISEICAKAIFNLSKDKQNEIFDELFDEKNCGFNYFRLPIGANDFAESWYSYDEVDGDYELEHFSIERDKKYIIPIIREAQKRSDEIDFFASPWSPPTWMKFPKVYNHGRLIETNENMKSYAKYLKRYLEEYEKNDISIKQLTFQNEFISDQKFPSCVWDSKTAERFLADYLIDEIGDLAEIWFGTYNGPEVDSRILTSRYYQYVGTLMQNEKCRNNINGIAFQWKGSAAIVQANEDFPDMNFINSETECGDGKNTWEEGLYIFEMMHHYFRFGARACVYWNMALEDGGISTWGWRQNSLISIKDDDYEFNPEFYMYKHFSHFIKRGATIMGTKGSFSSNATVFKNPDGTCIAVIANPFDNKHVITIKNKNYELKPRSFNTILVEE